VKQTVFMFNYCGVLFRSLCDNPEDQIVLFHLFFVSRESVGGGALWPNTYAVFTPADLTTRYTKRKASKKSRLLSCCQTHAIFCLWSG